MNEKIIDENINSIIKDKELADKIKTILLEKIQLKNKYICNKEFVANQPLNIDNIIKEIKNIDNNIIHPNENNGNNIDNLKTIYYHISNIFIDYIKNENDWKLENINNSNGKVYISKEDLYDNTIKFLPHFNIWYSNLCSLGGRKTKKRRCKKGTRKDKITKKCKLYKKKTNKKHNITSNRSIILETLPTDKIQIINKKNFRIGIDFGGVLSVYKAKIDNEYAEHINTELDMPNAINSLKKLKKLGNDLYLISYCGKNRAIETFNAIEKKNVSNLFNEQFYVKSTKYKGSICKYIGCHFMIDDRKIILDNIKRYNNNIVTILFGNNSINDENILSHKFAKDWNDVIKIISETAYFEVIPNEDIDIEKMLSLKYYPENNKEINEEDYMTFD
jgi:hypothetical protein